MLTRLTRTLLTRFSQQTPASTQSEVIPKAPTLLPGELESFRYKRETERLYEGYTAEELYGVKYGVKHSPAIRAEMLKDNIAITLLLIGGVWLVIQNHLVFNQSIKETRDYIESDLTAINHIPEHAMPK